MSETCVWETNQSPTMNYFAKKLMEKYKHKYCCASIKHNIWYEFKNHRWIEIDSADSLRKLIEDELIIEYDKQHSQIVYLLTQCDDYELKMQYHREATRICKIIYMLNSQTFKNGIICECADIAYDPNFLKNQDDNIKLICFENGVYDLSTNEFRDGRPDDHVSLCTNYEYVEYDKNNKYHNEIKNYFNMLQPDKTMRKYLLTLLSTCLTYSGENFYVRQSCYAVSGGFPVGVLAGSGSNGKHKLMELMKYTMGDLFKPMDIMVLIRTSFETPELADKKGIRICPLDEPKATDEINAGIMKLCIGRDSMFITDGALNKEPADFRPQLNPFLLCNLGFAPDLFSPFCLTFFV
jgi:hypothetical protein